MELAKKAAVKQWTADPCGPDTGESEPGTREYAERLLKGRDEYAPWMADELGYQSSSGLDVLDVGCGQGIDVMRFAQAGATVTGIDLTPRHVDLARQHVEAMGFCAEIINADAETIPLPEESFDLVTSNGVLHHTPDMEAALRSVLRVLRPGGEARIIVYNRHSFHYYIGQVFEQGLIRGKYFRERSMEGVMSTTVEITSIGARPLVKVYSRKDMVRIMQRTGFVDVETRVRHLRAGDTFITRGLARLRSSLVSPERLDRLGRVGGWYVIASGRRPSA